MLKIKSIQNCNFEAYVRKKESFLEIVNNTFRLKRSHQYYYQVQQQLFVTVLAVSIVTLLCVHFLTNNQCFFSWREFTRTPPIGILFFPNLPRCGKYCILPEVLGRWYIRKHDIAAPPPMSTPGQCICYCRKPTDKMILHCENPKCPFIEFHYSCLEYLVPFQNHGTAQEIEKELQENLTEPE